MRFFYNEIIKINNKTYIFEIKIDPKYHKCDLCSLFEYCMLKPGQRKFDIVFDRIDCKKTYLKEIEYV